MSSETPAKKPANLGNPIGVYISSADPDEIFDPLQHSRESTRILRKLFHNVVLEDKFDWDYPWATLKYSGAHDKSHLIVVAGIDIINISGKDNGVIVRMGIEKFGERVLNVECKVNFKEKYRIGRMPLLHARAIVAVLNGVKEMEPDCYPQLLIIQGNGTWDINYFGLACRVGILSGIPTIGVCTSFQRVPRKIEEIDVKKLQKKLHHDGDCAAVNVFLDNAAERIRIKIACGAIMKTGQIENPYLYVSPGHLVCLETAGHLARHFQGPTGLPTSLVREITHW